MDGALYLSALGLGLAGIPHCAAMCAAPCAAVTQGTRAVGAWGFHLARAGSYAVAGALAAASVNSLQALGALSPVFRPLWTLVHLAALLLGLWLLVYGRQPAWIERIGRQPVAAGGGWTRVRGPGRPALVGALWVAWPCGLLQSAVLVAALGNTPWVGAGVMLVFAGASAAGLTLAPWVWRRLGGQRATGWPATAGVRLAGAVLAAAALWAMGRGMWSTVAAYCGF